MNMASVSLMWEAMQRLHPGEVMRFTGNAAREITACVDEVPITPHTDDETLQLILPMPFAEAMAGASTEDHADLNGLPREIVAFLEATAEGCRRVAARDAAGTYAFPVALGKQATVAIRSLLELPADELAGLDIRRYTIWSIYRSYIEVLLGSDPLPPEMERAALAVFESGQRIAGVS
jgi:hypothetical protein